MTATYSDVTEGDKKNLYKEVSPTERPQQKDPALELLKRYLKPVLIGFAIVGAVWYGKLSFENSRKLSLEGASESFDTFRDDIESYSEVKAQLVKDAANANIADAAKLSEDKRKDLEKREKELKSKVEEEARALASVKEPYKTLSKVYEAIFLSKTGDLQKSRDLLQEMLGADDSIWKLGQDETVFKKGDKIFLEGALLKLANTLIDAKDPKGLELLKKIANEGSIFAVPAGISLANLADTPDRRADALVILLALQTKFPEQASGLDDEVEKLK